MISSVRLDGSKTCMAIDGATDTEVFGAYVREVLRPTLKAGDIVVMDNLTPDKNEETLALPGAAGVHVWFLPAYSPDLDPIEKMWRKVKQALRSWSQGSTRSCRPQPPPLFPESQPPIPETGSLPVATLLFKML
jgi:transposase